MRPALLRCLPLLTLLVGCFDADPAVTPTDAADDGASDAVALDRPTADVGTADTGTADTGTDAGPLVSPDQPSVDVPALGDAADAHSTDALTTDALTTDAATNTDAAIADDAAEKCIGRPSSCIMGTPGGICGDTLTPPLCEGGSWRCPEGTIPVTECACSGRPPGGACTCSAGGWVCPDAGR
ncbi:MAG: hypothetical protein Q8S73_43585 [Deltaproteobacteria bacterium]|nr:hypothetical protein [Myxococcales bacterium]MDP3221047.1 hypothetical protein [Deltaproteobacteria bacterium]